VSSLSTEVFNLSQTFCWLYRQAEISENTTQEEHLKVGGEFNYSQTACPNVTLKGRLKSTR
jgi:hypothetical protein